MGGGQVAKGTKLADGSGVMDLRSCGMVWQAIKNATGWTETKGNIKGVAGKSGWFQRGQ